MSQDTGVVQQGQLSSGGEPSCQAMNSLWLLSDHADTDSSIYLHLSLSQLGRPKNKISNLFFFFFIPSELNEITHAVQLKMCQI